MKNKIAASVVLSVAGILSLVSASQAQVPISPPPIRIPPPPIPQKPDPAASSIELELLTPWRPSAGGGQMARARIVGVVTNRGLAAFRSTPGLQEVHLYEDGRRVARQEFINLELGGEVRVTFDRNWDLGSSHTYFLKIVYDPAISSDGLGGNDDANFTNNRLTQAIRR